MSMLLVSEIHSYTAKSTELLNSSTASSSTNCNYYQTNPITHPGQVENFINGISENGSSENAAGNLESAWRLVEESEDSVRIENMNHGMTAPIIHSDRSKSKATISGVNEALQTVEFSFLDNKNVCCGLCGEIVPYDNLLADHLPNSHPALFATSTNEHDDLVINSARQQRNNWETLREKLSKQKRVIENGFKMSAYRSAARARTPIVKRRQIYGEEPRKVSTIRVNPRSMSLMELEFALSRKMVEKLGRHVPVTLVDNLHARCGLCNSVISLNKKFEIVHLVRHFNCWHPTLHNCTGSWHTPHDVKRRGVKALSIFDFAVVDTGSGTPDSLQCIWCGMFVESHCLAQHFGDLHSDEVEVPQCNLCMQELILTARYQEKSGLNIQITLPDEHHMKCNECGASFSNELSLDNHVNRRHVAGIPVAEDPDADEDHVNLEEIGPEAFSNSRMTLGKRRRPKRQFIMPALRQAVPLDSEYVEPIAECHWKCKVCQGDIYGAVISAAAIRHYKFNHPEQADNMQYEICKSRLEKISDGCMEFIHPQLIECLLCQQTFNLHQPFNMCRAIRHLKAKHPNLMPEYAGLSQFEDFEEDDDSLITQAAIIQRQGISTTNEIDHIMYTQPILQTDLNPDAPNGIAVYGVAQELAENEEEDEEAEEIIVSAGRAFSVDPTSAFAQQYLSNGGNVIQTPEFTNRTEDLGTPMAVHGGIRVFRTPQLGRSHYQHHQIGSIYQPQPASKEVAKYAAKLDHGAVVRHYPPAPQSMYGTGMNSSFMGRRTVDAPTPVIYQHHVQPRQFYLLIQPMNAATVVMQQDILDASSMEPALMDESMIESQKLAELMAQANATISTNQQHPHALMAGDDPY